MPSSSDLGATKTASTKTKSNSIMPRSGVNPDPSKVELSICLPKNYNSHCLILSIIFRCRCMTKMMA